jgi:hypothetical protein
VPRRPARDQVEPPAGVVPGLERGDLDRDAAAARDSGHLLVGLDAEHPEAPAEEPGRRLAGAAADVEHALRLERREVVDERVRVGRAVRVVLLGHRAERLSARAIEMRKLHGERGMVRSSSARTRPALSEPADPAQEVHGTRGEARVIHRLEGGEMQTKFATNASTAPVRRRGYSAACRPPRGRDPAKPG